MFINHTKSDLNKGIFTTFTFLYTIFLFSIAKINEEAGIGYKIWFRGDYDQRGGCG